MIKVNLEHDLLFTKYRIGFLDSAFFLFYAMSQFLLFIMLACGLTAVHIGLTTNFYGIYLLLALNGFFQGFFWPIAIKVISNLFARSEHLYLILGIFGTSAFASGTFSTLFTVYIRDTYGWEFVFPITSLVIIVDAIIFIIFYYCFKRKIKPYSPPLLSTSCSEENNNLHYTASFNATKSTLVESDYQNDALRPSKRSKITYLDEALSSLPKTIVQALFALCRLTYVKTYEVYQLYRIIPMLFDVTLVMFCIKTIRYTIYMWLPLLLEQKTQYTRKQAGNSSALFEFGGLVGCFALGYVLDKCYSRLPLRGVYIFLFGQLLSTICFILTTGTGEGKTLTTSLSLMLFGFFVGGLDKIVGSCVPIYIARETATANSYPTEEIFQHHYHRSCNELSALTDSNKKIPEDNSSHDSDRNTDGEDRLIKDSHPHGVKTLHSKLSNDFRTTSKQLSHLQRRSVSAATLIGLISGIGTLGAFLEGPIVGSLLISYNVVVDSSDSTTIISDVNTLHPKFRPPNSMSLLQLNQSEKMAVFSTKSARNSAAAINVVADGPLLTLKPTNGKGLPLMDITSSNGATTPDIWFRFYILILVLAMTPILNFSSSRELKKRIFLQETTSVT